jgi:hypothetical protein
MTEVARVSASPRQVEKLFRDESSVADKRTPSGRLATQCKSEGEG